MRQNEYLWSKGLTFMGELKRVQVKYLNSGECIKFRYPFYLSGNGSVEGSPHRKICNSANLLSTVPPSKA